VRDIADQNNVGPLPALDVLAVTCTSYNSARRYAWKYYAFRVCCATDASGSRPAPNSLNICSTERR